MPIREMLGIYVDPTLWWWLSCVIAGAMLTRLKDVIPSRMTALHAEDDAYMTRPSPGLRPPSPRKRGEGQLARVSRFVALLPASWGEGGRRPDEGPVILSRRSAAKDPYANALRVLRRLRTYEYDSELSVSRCR